MPLAKIPSPALARSGHHDGDGRSIRSTGSAGCSGVPSSRTCTDVSLVGPYLWSQNGRALLTSGIAAKLYSGGGEDVVHSSVAPSHGSFPASSPARVLLHAFTKKTSTPSAITKAPTVATRFHVS